MFQKEQLTMILFYLKVHAFTVSHKQGWTKSDSFCHYMTHSTQPIETDICVQCVSVTIVHLVIRPTRDKVSIFFKSMLKCDSTRQEFLNFLNLLYPRCLHRQRLTIEKPVHGF